MNRGLKRLGLHMLPAAYGLFLLGPVLWLFGASWLEGAFERLPPEHPQAFERLYTLLWATLRLALGTTVLAVILGVTVAVAIHRSRGFYRRLLEAAMPVPLLLPPMVVAIAWTHLLGKRGIAAAIWFHLTGDKALPFSMYGEFGSACVLASCWFPLVTFPTLVGLRALGPQLSVAGRLYAPPHLRVCKLGAPLLAPYVSAGAVFVAWLTLGDFDVPSVFLRNAFSLEIYAAFQINPSPGQALLRCLPLLGLSAVVLVARLALLRGEKAPTLDSQWGRCSRETPGSDSRLLKAAAALVLVLAVGCPMGSLIHQASTWETVRAGLETARPQILHTFKTAFVAGLLSLGLGAPYAYGLARSRGLWRGAWALLALLPLAIPGTVHGLAWIEALKGSAVGRALLESPYLLSLAHAARFFPFAVFLLSATFEGLHRGLFDAGRVSGATPPTLMRRIALPLAWPGLLAAFAIVFALSAGELSSSILLNPIGVMTLPTRLSSLLHFGKDELLAALCLVQVFLLLVPYLTAAALLEKTLEVRFA